MKVVDYERMSIYRYPFHILIHPFVGYEEMRWNKKESSGISFAILTLWFLSSIFSKQVTDFIFNPYEPNKINLWMEIATTFLIFLIAVLSNTAFATFLDGIGRFRDVWIFTSYALIPKIIATVSTAILSLFLVIEEDIFLNYLLSIGNLWTFFVMLVGLMVVHEYKLKRTVASIFLTILGVLIILFVITLLFSLYQQLYIFIVTIYKEIMFSL